MLLSRIAIDYFRSLYNVDLHLKPITIIIGPNASGKSNLFKAFRFVYDGVSGELNDWRKYDAQIDDLIWYGLNASGERPSNIDFKMIFDRSEKKKQFHISYQLNLLGEDYWTVNKEELTLNKSDEEAIVYFQRERDVVLRL